jgi:predicted XRE-type DNA-binding protein
VILVKEVEDWFVDLAEQDPESSDLVAGALDLLEEQGPALGWPAVDRIKGPRLIDLKELRPGSNGSTEIRILFIFDPDRHAVLLVAGDKSGSTSTSMGFPWPTRATGRASVDTKRSCELARNWRDVKADAVASGRLDEQRANNARKELHDAVRANHLADVRKDQDVRQKDVAAIMNVSQARVSKIERGDLSHTELGTLESYVEALGGHLRVIADFGDKTIIFG